MYFYALLSNDDLKKCWHVEPLEEWRRLHVMKSTFTILKCRHRLYTISGLFENFFSICGQLFACQNGYIFTDIRERRIRSITSAVNSKIEFRTLISQTSILSGCLKISNKCSDSIIDFYNTIIHVYLFNAI